MRRRIAEFRGINAHPAFALPSNVRIAIMTRVIPRDFKQSRAISPPHSAPRYSGYLSGAAPRVAPILPLPPGALYYAMERFLSEGRTPRLSVPLINGETHARKNARRFRPVN